MNHSELFKYPGELALIFFCSLFDLNPSSIEPAFYSLLAIFLALVIWFWLLKIAVAIIKKTFGFGDGNRYP